MTQTNETQTTRIPPERLHEYFERFTKRFLLDGSPEAVDVELVQPELGDQHIVEGARLLGITCDPKTNALEFALDSGDHRVYVPSEVWVVEEPDGFVSAMEIVRADGSREVVSVKRVGLRRVT
jgi:hypothetical protein